MREVVLAICAAVQWLVAILAGTIAIACFQGRVLEPVILFGLVAAALSASGVVSAVAATIAASPSVDRTAATELESSDG